MAESTVLTFAPVLPVGFFRSQFDAVSRWFPRLRGGSRWVQRRLAATVCSSRWSGLEAWRSAAVNEDRLWGANGPARLEREGHGYEYGCGYDSGKPGEAPDGLRSLAEWGALVLTTSCPLQKSILTHQAFQLWSGGALGLGVAAAPDAPGRPLKPELVHPRDVPLLKSSPLPVNAHLLHNLAHIELNAIDLAWDTVVRFSMQSEELGVQFFTDFAHVADDESRHLGWCLQRLKEVGFSYGDMPAHNLLWKDCQKTSGDVAARLAVIPMTQEARGLDAGPRLVEKLIQIGDSRSAGIVQKIVDEELAHVAVGVTWFQAICRKVGINPELSFKGVMQAYNVQVRGPFNYEARAQAGIPREWFDSLTESGQPKEAHLDDNIKLPRGMGQRKGAREDERICPGGGPGHQGIAGSFCEGQTVPLSPPQEDRLPTEDLRDGHVHLQLLKVKERLEMIVALESESTLP